MRGDSAIAFSILTRKRNLISPSVSQTSADLNLRSKLKIGSL